MINYIVLILFIILFVKIMEEKLSNIEINVPKQDIIINLPENIYNTSKSIENEVKKIEKNIKDNVEGFENIKVNEPFITTINEKKDDICMENHQHIICKKGRMNYPDPKQMSPIDKKYFKYNYQSNFTIQDYINWLWQYLDTEDELPYIHLKNFLKLKNGNKINKVPQQNTSVIKNSEEYYQKMYTEGFKIEEKSPCQGYNYNQYPSYSK
jgi:hypothetical protein